MLGFISRILEITKLLIALPALSKKKMVIMHISNLLVETKVNT